MRTMVVAALDGVAARLDRDPRHPPETEVSRARGLARILRCQETDPDGSWLAEQDGQPVGLALALRRGQLWFLSLLAVAEGLQGVGVGARLMEAALGTYDGASSGLITCSRDPRALRRYQLAGFALQPCFAAGGWLDRALVPASLGVRAGDLARDRDLCEDVATRQRGSGHGGDLDAMLATGHALHVAERGRDRGFACAQDGRVVLLGATAPALAAGLLWAALAEAGEAEVTVPWLTARQQWALDVVLAARLSLTMQGAVAVRGAPGPLSPYLPSGAWG